jgi:hypothetical protein
LAEPLKKNVSSTFCAVVLEVKTPQKRNKITVFIAAGGAITGYLQYAGLMRPKQIGLKIHTASQRIGLCRSRYGGKKCRLS